MNCCTTTPDLPSSQSSRRSLCLLVYQIMPCTNPVSQSHSTSNFRPYLWSLLVKECFPHPQYQGFISDLQLLIVDEYCLKGILKLVKDGTNSPYFVLVQVKKVLVDDIKVEVPHNIHKVVDSNELWEDLGKENGFNKPVLLV